MTRPDQKWLSDLTSEVMRHDGRTKKPFIGRGLLITHRRTPVRAHFLAIWDLPHTPPYLPPL